MKKVIFYQKVWLFHKISYFLIYLFSPTIFFNKFYLTFSYYIILNLFCLFINHNSLIDKKPILTPLCFYEKWIFLWKSYVIHNILNFMINMRSFVNLCLFIKNKCLYVSLIYIWKCIHLLATWDFFVGL